MVRGFVQQEDIRTGHQGGGQPHAFAVSAGEIFHRPVQVGDPQALQHLLALLFQSPGLLLIHAFAESSQLTHQRHVIRTLCNGF